jgi:hypothetical protein
MFEILIEVLRRAADILIGRALKAKDAKKTVAKQFFELFMIVDRVATCTARLAAMLEAVEVFQLIVREERETALKPEAGWNPYQPSIFAGIHAAIREVHELAHEFEYVLGMPGPPKSYFDRILKETHRISPELVEIFDPELNDWISRALDWEVGPFWGGLNENEAQLVLSGPPGGHGISRVNMHDPEAMRPIHEHLRQGMDTLLQTKEALGRFLRENFEVSDLV